MLSKVFMFLRPACPMSCIGVLFSKICHNQTNHHGTMNISSVKLCAKRVFEMSKHWPASGTMKRSWVYKTYLNYSLGHCWWVFLRFLSLDQSDGPTERSTLPRATLLEWLNISAILWTSCNCEKAHWSLGYAAYTSSQVGSCMITLCHRLTAHFKNRRPDNKHWSCCCSKCLLTAGKGCFFCSGDSTTITHSDLGGFYGCHDHAVSKKFDLLYILHTSQVISPHLSTSFWYISNFWSFTPFEIISLFTPESVWRPTL